MTDRIAIMGGEPFAEWIERDDQAQRLFKAYRDKWPDGDAQCVAIGDEFYVRFDDGEMRHVSNLADFDDEDEWCAQCGTPIDPDSMNTIPAMSTSAIRFCARTAGIVSRATATIARVTVATGLSWSAKRMNTSTRTRSGTATNSRLVLRLNLRPNCPKISLTRLRPLS